jgi:hypothetical protein
VCAAVAMVVALGACSSGDGGTGSAGPAPGPVPTAVPAALAVPAGHRLVLTAEVERGSQVYACAGGAWSAATPAAALAAPGTAVLHVAGPRWIATADGSAVTARPTATSPVPQAVPELLLQATGHEGEGVLAGVDYVQRLATRGGQAPPGGCTGAGTRAVPYTAEYRFYAPAAP